MKKVIIIAMLLSLICVCGLSAGVCFADETTIPTAEWYYFEGTDTTPHLPLRESADDDSKVLLFIPHSYAFEKLEEPNGAFVKIRYNGKEGYIYTLYFNSNCKKVNSKWGNNSYAYDLSDVKVTADKITPYKKDDMSQYTTLNKSEFTIDKVYGYYFTGNDYYFLVDATGIVFDNPNKIYGYIKAVDTNYSNFKEIDIPENAGYTLQTTPEKPITPSGDINSGNTNPTVDKKPSDTQAPKNSLDRYILIAVIAVLCVVIMILIFAPTRKRQN